MTTHAHRWLAAFADSLNFVESHRGRVRVHVTSDDTRSSSHLALSADQARAVASLVYTMLKVDEPVLYRDVDIIDSIRTEAPAAPLSDVMVAAMLTARLRER